LAGWAALCLAGHLFSQNGCLAASAGLAALGSNKNKYHLSE